MRVIDQQEDPELVRRLATGLVARWEYIPAVIRTDILREATLANDPTPKRVQLQEQLRSLIEKLQKSLA